MALFLLLIAAVEIPLDQVWGFDLPGTRDVAGMTLPVVDEKKRLVGVIPRVTLLAALGNVTTSTGELPVVEPAATISVSLITETLRETALEGAQL